MQEKPLRAVVVGGGAAGCLAAGCLPDMCPEGMPLSVTVLERGSSPLRKVGISGGGRCNLTNSFERIDSLSVAYPRGDKLLRKLFSRFSPQDARKFFESRGVPLVTQEDGCVFPRSQKSSSIVGALLRSMKDGSVILKTSHRVESITQDAPGKTITISGTGPDGPFSMECEAVLITTGGFSGGTSKMLSALDLDIVPPLPSLFTLKIDDHSLRSLMGIVVKDAVLRIPGTSLRSEGELLLTDWGISGPATLRLSSYAARYLGDRSYQCPLLIDWSGGLGPDALDGLLGDILSSNPRKRLRSTPPPFLQQRLWEHILSRAGLRPDMVWAELGGKGRRKLVEILSSDRYDVTGRATFKEEFVTCGGVSLSEVDPSGMGCRKHPGIFFAGEVLDIDAITGGFNLQAAWTTGYCAAWGMAAYLGAIHENNKTI